MSTQENLAEAIEEGLGAIDYWPEAEVEMDVRFDPPIHRVEITADNGEVHYAVVMTAAFYREMFG